MLGLTTTTRATPLAKQWQPDFLMKKKSLEASIQVGGQTERESEQSQKMLVLGQKTSLGQINFPNMKLAAARIRDMVTLTASTLENRTSDV